MCYIGKPDFFYLFYRGHGKYDIAELPRIMSYSVDHSSFRGLFRDPTFSTILLYSLRVSGGRLVSSLNIIDYEKEKKVRLGNYADITLNYIIDYTKCLIDSIKENAKIHSKCLSSNMRYSIIEFYIPEEALNHILKREYVLSIKFCNNELPGDSYEPPINKILFLRVSSFKGIMRYTLFKLFVLYSLYNLIERNHIDSIRKIIRLLAVFSYILTYDDNTFLLTVKDSQILEGVLKKGILLLHSILFGSGTNRSLIFLERLRTDFPYLIRYLAKISRNSLFSIMILNYLLRHFVKRASYKNDITLEKLFYGLICLIVGSLNYICYLDGPFVPVLPEYNATRYYVNKIILNIYLPNELNVDDIIEAADTFLKFYVRTYILDRLNLEI